MRKWLFLLLAFSILCSAAGCGDDDRRPGTGVDAGEGFDAGGDVDATVARDVGPRPDVVDPVCETVSAVAEPVPATLVFQLDTSNSMNCAVSSPGCLTGDPTPAPDDSRWDVFAGELVSALGALGDETEVGLMRFPASEASCARDELAAPIASLADGRAAAIGTVEGITPNGFSTPTHDAVAFGFGRLRASGAERPFLVLATDGDARVCLGCDTACSFEALDRDNDDLVDRVAGAAEEGIPTFVIGVPGSQGYRDVLSRLATAAGAARPGCSDAGPTYCHYDLTDAGLDFGEALREVLGTIGEAVLPCEYDIPENPDGAFDPGRVNVRIRNADGSEETIPRDGDREAGWDYSDDMSRVELYGTACEAAREAEALDILFGCPTVLI